MTPAIKSFVSHVPDYGQGVCKIARNGWFAYRSLELYLRVGIRYVDGVPCACVQVASVASSRPGGGDFTKFIAWLESTGHSVFVESVLTERFAGFFHKRGYIRVGLSAHADISSCWFKM